MSPLARALPYAVVCALAIIGARDASGDDAPAGAPRVTRPAPKQRAPRRKRLAPRARSRAPHLLAAVQADAVPEPLVVEAELPPPRDGACPSDMVSIDRRYCVDRYEASLVEITEAGERPWSPFEPVDGHVVRAVSAPGVLPQGYVSGVQAKEACARSGKRLCRAAEWRKACAGPSVAQWGYAERRQRGVCNDSGRSPMLAIWHLGPDSPSRMWDPIRMNDPRNNQLPGSLAPTGSHPACTNAYGVFDMVGNLHEWIDDPSGTFQGGYYLDTTINGEGCGYRTRAHDFDYHDYSTGFRCCADPE